MKIIRCILFNVVRTILRVIAFFLFPRKLIHKERIPKKSKFVAVANHQHWADAVYLYIKGPGRVYMLAKKELQEKSRFLRVMRKSAGITFIDRENPSVSSIKSILGILKSDRPILVFPEGTRNKESNELMETKPGAAMFAIKARAPMIPMMVYERARAFRMNYVYVGEPFEFSEFYGQKLTEELLEEANAKMRAHMLTEMGNMREYVANKRRKKKAPPAGE